MADPADTDMDYSHEAPADAWSQTYLPSLPNPNADDSWRANAACRSTELDFHEAKDKKRCMALCGICPVTAECEDFAVSNRIEWGVYGGKSASVRKAERRGNPVPA